MPIAGSRIYNFYSDEFDGYSLCRHRSWRISHGQSPRTKQLKMNFLPKWENNCDFEVLFYCTQPAWAYVSYKQLPVELLPNAEPPVLFVQVSSQQDMDPSYVESEVIIPLEGAVSAIGGVDKLQSYIDRRQSSIRIDFKKNINFKMTSLKLREKVNEESQPPCRPVLPYRVQKVDIAQMNNN